MSVLRPMTTTEALLSANESAMSFKLSDQVQSNPALAAKGYAVNDLQNLLKCCKLISNSVGNDFASLEYDLLRTQTNNALLAEINHLLTTVSAVGASHDSLSKATIDDEQDDTGLFTVSFIKRFKMMKDPARVIEILLNILDGEFEEHDQQQQQQQLLSQRLQYAWGGDIYADILVSSFVRGVTIKYEFVRSLSMLLALISRLRCQLGLSPKLIYEIDGTHQFFDNIKEQTSRLLCLLAPQRDIFPMASFLTEKGQYKQLSVLLAMINENQVEIMAPYYYLMGLCFAHFNKYKDAYECLLKSTDTIDRERGVDDNILKICALSDEEIVPSIFVKEIHDDHSPRTLLMCRYLAKCSKIFELRNQVEYTIQLSLLAIKYLTNEVDQLTIEGDHSKVEFLHNKISALYLNVFKYALKISQFELAYFAIVKNPSHSMDCLHRLLIAMCESNQISMICSLPFVGTDHIVEEILSSKAKTQDLSLKPDYYDILYSLQMSRSNYRKGADNQWIAMDHQAGKVAPHKRKLFLQGSPNLQVTADDLWASSTDSESGGGGGVGGGSTIPIVTLKDMKREFVYLQSCLALRPLDATISDHLPAEQLLTALLGHGLIEQAFTLALANNIDLDIVFKSYTESCIELQINPDSANKLQSTDTLESWDLHFFNNNLRIAWTLLERYLDKYDTSADRECLSPSRVVHQSRAGIIAKRCHMAGVVVRDSVHRNESNSGATEFRVAEPNQFYVDVRHSGKMPFYFAEGYAVVVSGEMTDGWFIADKVYAKASQSRHHELVASTILSHKSRLDLPNWLIQWFKSGREEILFKLYFKHGRIEEAINTLLDMMVIYDVRYYYQ
eukprot:gene17523-20909_t